MTDDADDTHKAGDGAKQPGSAELRKEVESLRAQLSTIQPPTEGRPRHTQWWRTLVSGILVALLVVISPLCIVAAWAHREISSTDTYVETVTPLATNPAVQDAITDRLTTEILKYVDVQTVTRTAIDALADRGLPPTAQAGLQALSVPLSNAIQTFIHDQVEKVVQSDAFATAWVAANREAHGQLVAALTGQSDGAISTSDGAVTINLAALIDTVKTVLVDQGFNLVERLPTINASFVIFQSADLAKAQRGFDLLDTISTVLPLIALALLVAAIVVAKNRRKATIAAFLGIAGGMLLLGLAIAGFRPVYLDALPTDQVPQAAAAAIYDTLVSFIRTNLRGVLIIALLVAFAAWVAGPSSAAKQLRDGVRGGVGAVRNKRQAGFDTGPVGRALWTYRTIIRVALVAIAALYLLFTNPVTGARVIVTVLIAAVVWLLVELLAAPPPPPDDVGHEPSTADPANLP